MGANETIKWLIKNFNLPSSLKILNYYKNKKLKKLTYTKTFNVSFKFLGEKIRFNIRDNNDDFAILREIFLFRAYKTPKLDFEPQIIFDLGSHIGASAVYLGKKFPNARVYCFEPDENSRKLLKQNLDKNNINYKLFPYAVSDKRKVIRFYSNKNNPAFSKIGDNGNIKIQAIGLNEVLRQEKIKNIDILKIDVEGEETKILPTIKTKIKLLMCENHNDKYSFKEIERIINNLNLKLIPPMKHWNKLNEDINYPILIAR